MTRLCLTIACALLLPACGDPPISVGNNIDMRVRDMAPAPGMECTNGFTDGEETDLDCGGPSCPRCDSGRMCQGARDCASGICVNKACATPACGDMVKNGDEADTDCGGSCQKKCAEGQHCKDGPDCASLTCVNGVCGKSPCTNMVLDGMETDVDCGGPLCDKCGDGKLCGDAADCASDMCVNQVCRSKCPMGMGDCDGNAINGCESSLLTDAKNCGACGKVCPMGMPTCDKGACTAMPASCRLVNGIRWCFNPNACGENCTQVCKSLGLPLTIDDNTWFFAQSGQKCNDIAAAFGQGVGTANNSCATDTTGNHTAPGGLNGSLCCSSVMSCPAFLRVSQDHQGVPCGPNSMRSVCPCQ